MQDRHTSMIQELHKAQDVREKLRGLEEVARSYPADHDMRQRLESMNIGQILEMVENDISTLRDALLHPGGS